MGSTGNMIIKDFIKQMCIPLENMHILAMGTASIPLQCPEYIFKHLAQ